MQALSELQSLGYRAELAPTGKIRLTWTRPDTKPDPAAVSLLLEDLRAHRDQAVDHLRRTVAVDVSTPGGRKVVSIYADDGKPTPEAVDVADDMLEFIAEQPGPVPESEVLSAVAGDATFKRNILNRLVLDGIAELAAPGLYTIPSFPPAPANLPPDCPLQGGPVPTGCRFHPKLFGTLYKQGVLPLPGGRCPLRSACAVGSAE